MDACIVLGVASLAIVLLLGSRTFAQTSPAPTDVVVTINTANKFQQVLASSGTARRMLRIGNNNDNDDSCWLFVGSGRASKEGSYEVPPGKEYLRYPPFVPPDAIQATCESSSDTLDGESIRNRARRIHDEKISPLRKFCEKFLDLPRPFVSIRFSMLQIAIRHYLVNMGGMSCMQS